MAVGLAEGDALSVCEIVAVGDVVALPVDDGENETDGDALADAESVCDSVGVPLVDADALSV